jgi:CRP-like cAMP-binding protein
MPTRALRKFSFLEGCTLSELRAFWNLVDVKSFEAGNTIFNEGDNADDFFLLAEGMVELHRADRCLAVVYAGEPFGEMALTAQNHRTTTAIAINDCKALVLRRHRFFQLIREQSPLANHMLLRMFANAVQIVQKQNIKIADKPH